MIVLCIVTMLPGEANEVIYNDVDDRRTHIRYCLTICPAFAF